MAATAWMPNSLQAIYFVISLSTSISPYFAHACKLHWNNSFIYSQKVETVCYWRITENTLQLKNEYEYKYTFTCDMPIERNLCWCLLFLFSVSSYTAYTYTHTSTSHTLAHKFSHNQNSYKIYISFFAFIFVSNEDETHTGQCIWLNVDSQLPHLVNGIWKANKRRRDE